MVDENDNHVLDSQGHPVVALNRQRSKYMLEIDYERLVFQNDPEVKVCLATYGAGSQSVNFTAADVIIKDDLPEDCIRDYQAEDRIHRINPQNPKAEVRYYSLISEYDETFLDKMKALMIDKTMPYGSTKIVSAYDLWFEQGTLDGVNLRNLAAHRVGFELLNNGISVDPDLVEEEVAFNM